MSQLCWILCVLYTDEAGFHEAGQVVYEEGFNGDWINEASRERIHARGTAASICAFCLQSTPGNIILSFTMLVIQTFKAVAKW